MVETGSFGPDLASGLVKYDSNAGARDVRIPIFETDSVSPDVRIAIFEIDSPKPDVRIAVFEIDAASPHVRHASIRFYCTQSARPDWHFRN